MAPVTPTNHVRMKIIPRDALHSWVLRDSSSTCTNCHCCSLSVNLRKKNKLHFQFGTVGRFSIDVIEKTPMKKKSRCLKMWFVLLFIEIFFYFCTKTKSLKAFLSFSYSSYCHVEMKRRNTEGNLSQLFFLYISDIVTSNKK